MCWKGDEDKGSGNEDKRIEMKIEKGTKKDEYSSCLQ